MNSSIETLVGALGLAPHPEGGFYAETYRAQDRVHPPRGPRSASTAIYFLLTADSFSAFHRIQSDEVWHFYAGDALEIVCLDPTTSLRADLRLGLDVAGGERPQHVVPAGHWFGSRVVAGGRFALVGCTVAPGFDFADFELAGRSALASAFPDHATVIGELTRLP